MSNTVELVGNATREPELRYTPTGQATTTFGLAVNRRWQNQKTNEWEEATSFIDVVCWRDLAEHVAESVKQGTRLIVVGRMEQRSWETTNGEKRSKIEIVADEIGPSLRWATAEVKKAARDSGSYQGRSNSQPVANAPAQVPAMSGAPSAETYADEEPF